MIGQAEIIFSVLLGLFIVSCLLIFRAVLKSTNSKKRMKYSDPKLKNSGSEIGNDAILPLRAHYNTDER